MGEVVMIDVDEIQKPPEINCQVRPEKTRKRKRACMVHEKLGKEEREAKIEAVKTEVEGLFGYYKEVMGRKVDMDLNECNSSNAVIAAFMEESALPLSKLVDEIYEKMMKKVGNGSGGDTVTVASVKASVLSVGQRVMYGLPNADADILEDDSEACLWCWEARDVKLMPKSIRGTLNIRRACRKKIHERITAVSAMIMSLKQLDCDQKYNQGFIKASERLCKVFDEPKIRSFVDGLSQKNASEMAEKATKREEKLLAKQLERDTREAEKEKKRMDRELQKQKLQSEKELREDEKRREREESEMRKQLRKQQDEAEKDLRRRKKEETELKRQLDLQKQASIMEKFLKRSKPSPACQNDQFSPEVNTSASSNKKSENIPEALTQSMDCALLSNDVMNAEDILKTHLSSWHHLGHSIRANKKQHWGIRQKPKIEHFKEPKLSNSRAFTCEDEFGIEKLADGWGEQSFDDRTDLNDMCSSLSDVKKCKRAKQLLQFDQSHRPAFYGIWPKKSHVVGPRRPLRKDPDLGYDVDSDEEWEEEEPGESLSDCDKDDEEEGLEEASSKAEDEDGSEDGFFVPDGYLSENEGVHVDRVETDDGVKEAQNQNSPSCGKGVESEEFCTLLRKQKYLNSLTELALRKNQPLIILNIMHEKDSLLNVEDLSGTPKVEQACLQALSMCTVSGGSAIEISLDNMNDEDQEAGLSCGTSSTRAVSATTAIPDLDLPTVVSTIQSCSHGINKVVESLQQKFPSASKSYLKNKVREISNFVDNHWQVKKEILGQVGLSLSPEKGGGRTKSIATFFSKRCLPPTIKNINPSETSPPSSLKPGYAVQELQGNTYHQ